MRERTGSQAVLIDRATVIEDGTKLLGDISLRIEEGERVCILGPNGSGKSTLVRLMAGEAKARYHEPAPVRIFGEELWNLFSLRSRIGFVSDRLQSLHAGMETVHDVLLSAFFGSVGLPLREAIDPAREAKVREIASFLSIADLVGRQTASLSSGEMRRVLIGRALVHEPHMLLLDEPFTSLDIAARQGFASLLHSLMTRGHSLILVTHELSDIPPEIDRVILLRAGQVFADGPATDLLASEPLSELFGIALRVERGAEGYRAVVEARPPP